MKEGGTADRAAGGEGGGARLERAAYSAKESARRTAKGGESQKEGEGLGERPVLKDS